MIRTSIRNGIATITLSDCRLLSRYDLAEGRAFAEALQSAGDDDAVRAIVLLAAGTDFCAPVKAAMPPRAKLAEVQAVYGSESGVYQSLAYSRKAVVMGVQGRCAGAGSALALCADFLVMGRNASIQSPFSGVPEASFTLAALIMRLNRAKAWVLSDAPIAAADAEEAGLANCVVGDAQVRREALRMAALAARMPLDGIAISRVMLDAVLDALSVGKEFDQTDFYREGFPAGVVSTKGRA
jgi:enoyl-CoA hydratase/carnithine racemase